MQKYDRVDMEYWTQFYVFAVYVTMLLLFQHIVSSYCINMF
jgi:hypothetical protein